MSLLPGLQQCCNINALQAIKTMFTTIAEVLSALLRHVVLADTSGVHSIVQWQKPRTVDPEDLYALQQTKTSTKQKHHLHDCVVTFFAETTTLFHLPNLNLCYTC